jgi:propionyl-CoA synthetase
MPIKHGSCFVPMPGFDLKVLDENHNPVPNNVLGNLAIKLPLPPGFMLSLYNSDKRFIDCYM